MQFLAILSQIASIAVNVIPMIAMARKQADPNITNEGLINTANVIQVVKPLVDGIEKVSASGPNKMSGPDKLALLQGVVKQAHNAVTDAGGTTETFDAYWVPINAAVTAICAASKGNPIDNDTLI